MAAMLDAARRASIMNAILHGGTMPALPTALRLRLMTVQGSPTVNGTEATSGNCPGYTAGGLAITFGASTGGASASSALVTWTATGTWAQVTAAEVWDTAATPLRWFQGALATPITGVTGTSGSNVVSFDAGFFILNAVNW